MLSLRDCLDLADVTEDEIAAIVRHERIPLIVALELGHHLLCTPAGAKKVREFIVDDIAAAQSRHSCRECERFSRTLAQYLESHSECREPDSRRAPRLLELVAIGQAGQLEKSPEGTCAIHPATFDNIQDAKRHQDCCACARSSLELVRALDPADEPAGHGQD